MSKPWKPNVPFDKGSHEERLHKTYLEDYDNDNDNDEPETGPMHDKDCHRDDVPQGGRWLW